jgi:hypothetical protein
MQLMDLLPLLREKCAGMLDQQAKDQLKKSYRNFCIESGFIQRSETVSRHTDGSVTLTPDEGYYILSINSVDRIDGKELRQSVDYTVTASHHVDLASGFDSVIVTYSIAPNLPMADTLSLETELLQRWPDEIAAGAAALLRIMPKQTWTDVSLSDHYRRDFVKGHREAFRARVSANDERQFQPVSKRVFF